MNTPLHTITYYSYKGGTGRTLAVANTARFLARFGYKVFVLDLDLEAPGLHYKFGLRSRGDEKVVKGLVDFIHSYTTTKSVPELRQFVHEVTDLPSEFKGSIRLMPAGNAPSQQYSQQLAAIRLEELFNSSKRGIRTGGNSTIPVAVPLFLELKERIERCYSADYLLIDSRTGVTEIGGVAVRLMPDTVVCLVHNNAENLAGARKVLRNVRIASRAEGDNPIDIVAALVRIPEMPWDSERKVLKDVQEFFNEPAGNPEETLNLPEILALHSDPDLQVVEEMRFGGSTTANESILLRDYFKLFRKLRLDEGLEPEEKKVLEDLAEADHKDNIRPLLVGSRRLKGESALAPIKMRERLQGRSKPILKVVRPAYLTGPTYKKFINRVLQRLRGSVSLPEIETLPEEEVRWDLLAVHLREGVLDFCADIYYLTENRGHLVEIVQLGWCSTFSVTVRTNSEMHNRLKNLPERSFAEGLRSILAENPAAAVGVLGDTPAASEANRRLSPVLRATQLISKGSEEDLLQWLETASGKEDQRIVVCDHVVAHRLDGLIKEHDRYTHLEFVFAQPVPVGIVYPREDREWRKDLSKAIAYSLIDFLAEGQWDRVAETLGSVSEDFIAGGIDVLSLADLRSSLLLDLPFEEAIRWNREFQAAALHGVDRLPRRMRNSPMSVRSNRRVAGWRFS